ncbi:MAG: hypothetical protein K2G85_07520 [Muribaculaceae bacterium]|nr:hypothetical protein [Muribaculaceae bacterium]
MLFSFSGYAGIKIDANAHIVNSYCNDTDEKNLQSLFEKIIENSLPKEKVYLHLDNTSYYKDDTLWFSAYLVNSDGNTSDAVSKTLYVDLLNPGGDIVDTKVLKIENGRAHGSFKINCTPFYSGFFEIRAYTKYMMNFGPETAFSRVIPVFDAPKKEGDYEKRSMRKFATGNYTFTRKQPQNGKDINVNFYPEGGYLIQGIPTKIAFEAKDKKGYPIDISGVIFNANQDTVVSFKTSHEGKGMFNIIPKGKSLYAVIEYKGKTKKLNFPEVKPDGFSLSVDNLSNHDSISVTVNRGGIFNRIDTVGVILTSHGVAKTYSAVASPFRKPLSISFDKKNLSPGVAEVTLVDTKGRKIADRLFFNMPDSTDFINFNYSFDKDIYKPYEAINLSVSLTDAYGNPVFHPFSLSVRDGKNETVWARDICTDLMLMSDIKGYVANPGYYFESADSTHLSNLDLLMMVQGWRKYPWESLVEKKKENLRFQPESEGIEISGTVRSLTNKKMPDVDVTAFLIKGDKEDEKSIPPMDMTRTDSLGKFSFTVNIQDQWKLILNTTRKSKLIDSQIALDKSYIPHPRRFMHFEMDAPLASEGDLASMADEARTSQVESTADGDSINSYRTDDDKSVWLEEVKVIHKKNWLDDARAQARKRAVAYYEVDDEVNSLRDDGEYIDLGCDIEKLIMKLNPQFTRIDYFGQDQLRYKQKLPLIVVDYERLSGPTYDDYFRYRDVRLEAIKSISISEDIALKGKYCWNLLTPSDADKIYSCVVMIETYPDGKVMVDGGKGIRKTSMHGYDTPQEYYSPDYSVMPIEKDYRRTLYWNPDVIPDENGLTTVRFYNNSTNTIPKADIQTISPNGAIGATGNCR